MQKELVRIRKYNRKLLQHLADLEQQSFGEGGLTNKWLLVPMIKFGCVYALYIDGYLAGAAQLLRAWEEPQRAYLYGLSLHPKFRSKGLGTEFMYEILADLGKERFKEVFLTVHPKNKAAVHIYKHKFHFETLQEEKDAYGTDENRLVMRKDLHEQFAPVGN